MPIDPIEIQRIERAESLRQIEALDLPEEVRDEVYGLWRAVQEAVNAYARKEDRWIDERVLPITFRLIADEHERITRRARGGGGAPGG